MSQEPLVGIFTPVYNGEAYLEQCIESVLKQTYISHSAPFFLENAPYLAVFPGLAISVVVLAFNMLGNALRDLLAPRLRSR
jgi:cellulose synthase/poly-beta-1,6-N-acetylglucosamine synthase-like glycosyltransferase